MFSGNCCPLLLQTHPHASSFCHGNADRRKSAQRQISIEYSARATLHRSSAVLSHLFDPVQTLHAAGRAAVTLLDPLPLNLPRKRPYPRFNGDRVGSFWEPSLSR